MAFHNLPTDAHAMDSIHQASHVVQGPHNNYQRQSGQGPNFNRQYALEPTVHQISMGNLVWKVANKFKKNTLRNHQSKNTWIIHIKLTILSQTSLKQRCFHQLGSSVFHRRTCLDHAVDLSFVGKRKTPGLVKKKAVSFLYFHGNDQRKYILHSYFSLRNQPI